MRGLVYNLSSLRKIQDFILLLIKKYIINVIIVDRKYDHKLHLRKKPLKSSIKIYFKLSLSQINITIKPIIKFMIKKP